MYKELYTYVTELEHVYNVFNLDVKTPEIIIIDSNKSIKETKQQLIKEINKIFE